MERKAVKVVLNQLIKETGHVLAVEDSDDIIELDRLLDKVVNPVDVDEWDILSRPIKCGNVTLYPPTPAVLLWLKHCADVWFADEPELLDFAVPFALASSGEALGHITSGAEARLSIIKWVNKIKCPHEQIIRAIKFLLPDADDSDGDSTGFGPVIAFLCREYGESPHYWLHEASLGMIQAMIADFNARQIAETEAMRKAAASTKGATMPPLPLIKVQAIKKLEAFKKALREKWQM